jgi:hypothetical protein
MTKFDKINQLNDAIQELILFYKQPNLTIIYSVRV